MKVPKNYLQCAWEKFTLPTPMQIGGWVIYYVETFD